MEATQEQPFTEEDVWQLKRKVRALAQQWFADKKDEVDSEDSEDEEDELEGWLGRLDSELQEMSDLQERGSHLQGALKKLQEEVEDRRARSVEPAAEQVEALTLLRGASEVLRGRWPEDKPPNEWGGVTFKEGQVSELSFRGWRELESLPAEVGGLRALTSLNLSSTGLTTLPAEVGGLRALTSLDLSYNKALTTLPTEVGGLHALTSLNLLGTMLTMLPAEVGGLRALTSLNLSITALTTLPAKVGRLRALTSLNLSYNKALTTLPAKVGKLRALTSLNLSGTAITTLPAEASGLLALTSLDLSHNKALSTLPAEVGGLRALTSLDLRNTGLTTLPAELQEISGLQKQLKQLQEEVEDRRARNVEPAAEQVEALTLLRGASEVLRRGWPEDEPPNEWTGVTFKEGQVSDLDLRGCKLKSLPAEVGGLLALTSLDLRSTGLTTLPAEVGGLRALTSLNLAGTRLTTLPPEVGGLLALISLDLSYNKALTTLPTEVGGLHALTSLNLVGTMLTTLPAEVGGLRALTSLSLERCRELTTLPAEVGGLLALTSLDLSYNEALTTLPAEVGGLRALTSLNLYSTALTTLPAEMGGLRALTSLDLSHNKALTTLPVEMGGLRALTSLELRNTGLTTLPAEMGGLRALTSLNLSSTALTTLPAEVGGLLALTSLNLSHNKALTTLPAEVGGLRALTSLNLSHTALTMLPAEVGGLRALTSLNLASIALTTLPAKVGRLHALTSLDLSRTALTMLPAEVGGLGALTLLNLEGCDSLKSPPKWFRDDLLATRAFLLAKPNEEMLQRLRESPGTLHLLAEEQYAADFLRSVFEADPTLADSTDELGCTPIQHACPECGQAMRRALCLLGRFEIDDGPPLHFSATSAVVQADDIGGADAKPLRRALKAMRKAEQVLAELNGREGLNPEYKMAPSNTNARATHPQPSTPLYGMTSAQAWPNLTSSPILIRYVIAVLAVYVDRGVNEQEFQSIVTAAKQLQGVTVDWAPSLERRLSHELSVRVPASDNAVGSGAGAPRRFSSMQVPSTSATAAQEPQVARAAGYPFVIVLSLADRNLADVLTHDHVAGNDFPQIRMIMSHLGNALDNLHSEGRIHADFKPLNAARELTWKVIDMDVSRKFGESFDTKLPSSGYCPPEVAKVLLAVRNAETDEAKTRELAKYTASVAYDLWSFGVVLFNLCYGISLFNTDQNDNVSLRDLSSLAGWSNAILNRKVMDANKPPTPDFNAAADLIKMLLVSDPEERCRPFAAGCEMRSVLKHLFFQVGSEVVLSKEVQEQLDRIDKNALAAATNTFKLITMGEQHRSELRRTREVLLKAVFEATEVQTPTAFIILEEKLPDDEEEEKQMLTLKLKEDGTGFEVSGELAELVETVRGRFETGMKWVERIKTFSEGVVAADPIKTFAAMKATFKELITAETMYLYLIDELTGKPVKSGIYPIEITTPSEVVPQLLSVMQVGMRAMSLYNGAAGIARMCGAPLPSMPTGWCKGAQASIALLGQKSSVEQFGAVHKEVMSEDAAEREAKTVRGASLRELQSFFKEKDVGNTFAGLRRLGDDDGTAVWTVLTDDTEVRAAIEARAKERLAEQAAQDKFYCKLLLERKEPNGEASSLRQAAGPPPVKGAEAEAKEVAEPATMTAVGPNGAVKPLSGTLSTTVIPKEDHASTNTASNLAESQGSAETQKLDHASGDRVAQQLQQHQQQMEQLMTRNLEQIKSHIFAEMKKEQEPKGTSNIGRSLKRSALIKRIFISKTGRMRKQGPGVASRGQSIEPNAEVGRLHSARI